MIANEIIIHKKICPLKLSLYSLLYSFDACISHMIHSLVFPFSLFFSNSFAEQCTCSTPLSSFLSLSDGLVHTCQGQTRVKVLTTI
jgi:hypothetical protein